MQHAIKINRSMHLAGHLPMATAEISTSITPVLIEQLTAAQLAEVRRCLDTHWHKAVRFAERAALDEGGIWDDRKSAFRELAN